MKQRCTNPKTTNFEIYGGRGITYAAEWEDFQKFYEDMKEGFQDDLELDRIDVHGNYCKENCRWVTHNENNFNKTIQCNNFTGKTGVCFSEKIGKYRAYITIDGKQKSLGTHYRLEDAIARRKEAEIKYYGYERE